MPEIRRSIVALLLACSPLVADDDVSFARDVQPILARRCFPCHGPDEAAREADLRLDVRSLALEAEAIVPGDPAGSEVVARIESTDDDLRMPPAETGKPLTEEERSILRKWIESGAEYQRHWAFVPPRQPAVPEVRDADWCRNPIDRFVLARLERMGLAPSPAADRAALLRRVHLDLIGLPPTPAETEAFLADTSPDAYERVVDRLLASPRYGERWARLWLDLARYADTNGYEKDRPRSIWPYRDWVIRALNDDLPFDRFTIEQLAGDMLPDATPEQRIATGFHRNTMLNEEGGIDPLEYRFHAMTDRVATTGLVWLGLTTGCAQCHSHKYDPISHTDYYRLMALLDNADEPDLIVPTPDILERQRAIDDRIREFEEGLAEALPADEMSRAFDAWIEEQRSQSADWTILRPVEMATNLPRLEVLDDGSILSTGDVTKRDVFTLRFDLDGFDLDEPLTALRLEVLPDDRLPARGPGRAFYEGRKGDFFLSEVTARADEQPVKFGNATHSFGKISIGSGDANATNVLDGRGSTGWSTSGREGERSVLVLGFAEPLPADGVLMVEMIFERHFAASLGRFRFAATTAATVPPATDRPDRVERLLVRGTESWNDGERAEVHREFLRTTPLLAEARKPIEKLRNQRPEAATTMVMEERPADNPRTTHLHHRGEYLSPREAVTGGVPAFLPPLPEGEPVDRLTFARWLVSDENPLATRVTVNRAWRAFFGTGLVRTSGDFGTRSEPPTHSELLDWLARDLVDHGWSMKRLHRTIVTSATYRQSSSINPELLERDPSNRLLARGPGHRLDAEIVRDSFLAASGLISQRMGGPSSYPPQPASVTALAYGNTKWPTDTGDDRYRRSLYTFSKRTAPFAAYTVLDGPTGETCLARRDRSNTPLQALTLLNDEMFQEFNRALGRLVARQTDDPNDRVDLLFRRVLVRLPTENERQLVPDFVAAQRKRFEAGELDPTEIGGPGASVDEAIWSMLARSVMNIDEAVTKP